MIRIKNFNVPFNDQSPINDLVAKRLKLPPQHIDEVVIVRKGIDARRYKEAPIYFVYILDVKVNIAENKVLARLKKDKNVEIVTTKKADKINCQKSKTSRPIIIGFGPAGMFSALVLAKMDIDHLFLNVEVMWILDIRILKNFGKVDN